MGLDYLAVYFLSMDQRLKICRGLEELREKCVHGRGKRGLERDVVGLGQGLGKCGEVFEGFGEGDALREPDEVFVGAAKHCESVCARARAR